MTLYHAYVAVRMVQGLVAILFNLLTIISICKFSFLRTSYNILVASLALTDLLHGILFVVLNPLRKLWANDKWPLFRDLCLFSILAESILIMVQLITFSLLAIERYKSVKSLSSAGNGFTKRTILVMVTISWVVSIIYTSSMLMAARFDVENLPCSIGNYFERILPFSGVVIFFTSTCVTLFSYARISCMVLKYASQVGQQNAVPNAAQIARRKTEIRVTRMMALVVGIFFILYCPFFFTIVTLNENSSLAHQVIFYVTIIIYDVNFWINPAIYAWRNKAYRKAFSLLSKQFIRVFKCCHDNTVEVVT